MSRNVKTLSTCGLLGLFLAVLACRQQVLAGLADWLDVGQTPVCVDHVLVLPGDENIRPAVAAAMVNVGLAKDVLVPRTRVSQDERDGVVPANFEVIRAVLRHRGVPEERIVTLEGASGSTFDDVQALERFLADEGSGKVAVVTSGFHTRRTRLALEQVLGPEADEVAVVSAPNPGFHSGNWWQSREGFRLIINENIKLALYIVRYSPWTPWLLGSAVLVLSILAGSRWQHRTRGELASSQPQGAVSFRLTCEQAFTSPL